MVALWKQSLAITLSSSSSAGYPAPKSYLHGWFCLKPGHFKHFFKVKLKKPTLKEKPCVVLSCLLTMQASLWKVGFFCYTWCDANENRACEATVAQNNLQPDCDWQVSSQGMSRGSWTGVVGGRHRKSQRFLAVSLRRSCYQFQMTRIIDTFSAENFKSQGKRGNYFDKHVTEFPDVLVNSILQVVDLLLKDGVWGWYDRYLWWKQDKTDLRGQKTSIG